MPLLLTLLARRNLKDWPDICSIEKYNPSLGWKCSGTIIQLTICVTDVRLYAAYVLRKIYLLLYQDIVYTIA